MRILNKLRVTSVFKKKAGVILSLGLILFFIVYIMLMIPLRRSIILDKNEYNKLETRIAEGRQRLDFISKIDKALIESQFDKLNKRLPSKSPISAILEELTERGKEFNIEFISVTPIAEKTITLASREGKAIYRVLPIEINMRAGYKDIGEYIGVLENLESSFATISEFQINKDESISPSRLKVRMILYTYMSSAENKNE